MSLVSIEFFLFFSGVWLVFQVVPVRLRWIVVLLASLGFYATFKSPELILALAAVTFSSFFFGIWINKARKKKYQNIILWAGIAINIAVLALFKFWKPLISFVKVGSVFPNVLVSIGVSYFTLQGISYLVDISLDREKPERHLGRFALFMSFFPKILQGPIERSGHLLPQINEPPAFNYDRARNGLLLLLWGCFKKVVVADRLGYYVDTVFSNVQAFQGISLILGCVFFSFQIYADFSGYTDMALGMAKLFNIELTQNFSSPYFATSISEFWRRWHISFSRWILDYIFTPLQMRWRSWRKVGTIAALVITFLISGIWHGVSWGFVIWGLMHGFLLSSSYLYKPLQKKLHNMLRLKESKLLHAWQIIVTFCMVTITWIFFRAESMSDAIYVISHLGDKLFQYFTIVIKVLARREDRHLVTDPIFLGKGSSEFILAFLSVVIIMISKWVSKRIDLFHKPLLFRWVVYYALVIGTYFMAGTSRTFIYFQF
jgi:D-alanyl-lipoteichoic acid acyltransferase DltB (MBOAT superfamily)